MINKDSLKTRANNISKELNITQNAVYNRFFYDAFLSRLAVSSYKDKLILKGGLYLSSLLGIDMRTTMDIDFYLKKVSMEKDTLIRIVNDISSIDLDDGITFEIMGISDIREDDLYGGFQITLKGKLDNVTVQFGVDVATGDPIVPSESSYDYQCLVTGKALSIKTYSLESIVAEKLETILSRGITNSRSKDYYDLYILRKTQITKIDINMLKEAFKQTCRYRNYSIKKGDALMLLDEIVENTQMNKRWISYGHVVKYAEDLNFKEVVAAIKEWINECFG